MNNTGHFNVEREFPMTSADFEYISRFVTARTGITLNSNKVELVYTRLSRRLRKLKINSFADYVQLLNDDNEGEETSALVNALTTNLTKFFRSHEHFDHIRDVVIKDCRERIIKGGKKRIRIWSAGCSTGEEPYSIAISLSQALGDRIKDFDIKILATDIDTNILSQAASGVYDEQALEDVDPKTRHKFFTGAKSNKTERWAVKESVRSLVTFKKLNLQDTWPLKGPFDAIFCRNVMIYFAPPVKEQLINRFVEVLRPGGWIYLGSSESITFSCPGLERAGQTIYRWKN